MPAAGLSGRVRLAQRAGLAGTRHPFHRRRDQTTGAGGNNDRIEVQLAGVPASKAQDVIGRTAQLVTTKWVADSTVTAGPWPGYRPQETALRADMLTSANAQLDPSGGTANGVVGEDAGARAPTRCGQAACEQGRIAGPSPSRFRGAQGPSLSLAHRPSARQLRTLEF